VLGGKLRGDYAVGGDGKICGNYAKITKIFLMAEKLRKFWTRERGNNFKNRRHY